MAKSPILTYPHTLRADAEAGTQPFMSFQLKQQNQAELGDMIFLYLPANLSSSDGASYTGAELGAGRQVKAVRDEGKGKAVSTKEDLAAVMLSKFKLGGEAMAAVAVEASIKSGIALNPFTNMTFESMSPRTWSFEFKMISESAEEAESIRNIENFFRKNMYPEKAGALSLKYPPQVRTQFWDGESESRFLPMIMDSYIQTLDVTWNESNQMFHADGAPIETTMTLSLAENRSLTRGDLYGNDLEYNRGGRDNMASDIDDKTTVESLGKTNSTPLPHDQGNQPIAGGG
jgi:hypothetical protein